MRLSIKRYVLEGDVIPYGFGISYRGWERDASVAYPLVLHWIVRWARDLRFWVMWVGLPGFQEETERRFYVLGRNRNDDASGRTIEHYVQLLEESRAQRAQAYHDGWSAACREIDKRFESFIARSA